MATILAAIPVWKIKAFGGLEISLLLFAEDEVVFLRGTKNVGGSKLSIVSPIAEAIAFIMFGRKAKEIKERIDSLRGLSIDIQELIKSSEKGGYTIPYNELKSIY